MNDFELSSQELLDKFNGKRRYDCLTQSFADMKSVELFFKLHEEQGWTRYALTSDPVLTAKVIKPEPES